MAPTKDLKLKLEPEQITLVPKAKSEENSQKGKQWDLFSDSVI